MTALVDCHAGLEDAALQVDHALPSAGQRLARRSSPAVNCFRHPSTSREMRGKGAVSRGRGVGEGAARLGETGGRARTLPPSRPLTKATGVSSVSSRYAFHMLSAVLRAVRR